MIEKQYGATYRMLRQDKGISLAAVVGTKLTSSFVSKFERGMTTVSFPNMLYLLDQINVTLDEFMMHVQLETGNQQGNELIEFFNKMNTASNASSHAAEIVAYEKLLQEYQQLARDDYNIRNYFITLLLKFYIKINAEDSIIQARLIAGDSAEAKVITEYLYSVENWERFEVLLFINIVFALPLDQQTRLAKIAIHRSATYSRIPTYHFLAYGLLKTLFMVFVAENEPSVAKETLETFRQMLNEKPDDKAMMNNWFMLQFDEGIYEMMFGDYPTGLAQATKYRDLFKAAADVTERTDNWIDVTLENAIANQQKAPADWEFAIIVHMEIITDV